MTTMNCNMESYSNYPFVFSKENGEKETSFRIPLFEGASNLIIDLEIGKKYYTFKDGKLKAFKVLSVAIHKWLVDYDIQFADGSKDHFNGNHDENPNTNRYIRNIFKDKESFLRYRESRDSNDKYYQMTTINDILYDYYADDLLTTIYDNSAKRDYFVPKVYSLNKLAKPYVYKSLYFKSFWIDAKGLHFESWDILDSKLFWTREECEKSFEIDDFEEEPVTSDNVKLEITIPRKNINKVKNFLSILGIRLNY